MGSKPPRILLTIDTVFEVTVNEFVSPGIIV